MVFSRRKIALALILYLIIPNTYAVNAWYYGPVTNLLTYTADGSFYVYVDNPNIISTCPYKRVIFRVQDMGIERTKAALSMAMVSLVTGKNWGVVIDMPTDGSTCYAAATSVQGAGLRK